MDALETLPALVGSAGRKRIGNALKNRLHDVAGLR